VEFWTLEAGKIEHTYRFGEFDKLYSLLFHPDGRWALIGASVGLEFLDVTTWKAQPGPTMRLSHPKCGLSPDGRVLIAGQSAREMGALQAWRVGQVPLAEPFWLRGPQEWVFYISLALCPDGRQVAVSVKDGVTHPGESIQVLDTTSGKVTRVIPHDPADPIRQIAFTADGTTVLIRCDSRTIKAFEVATGFPAGELVHPRRSFVTSLAVHPGGQAIATCRNDGMVWFWEPTTFQPIRTFDWKLGKLVSVAFSPDGLLAAAGTEDGQIVVWDLDW
jgi:WD40 repeat protein